MSGIYNYHPTIAEPEKFTIQTASQQKPFFFGGSQVPINLDLSHHDMQGQGIGSKCKQSISEGKGLGKLKQTSHNKAGRTLPRF